MVLPEGTMGQCRTVLELGIDDGALVAVPDTLLDTLARSDHRGAEGKGRSDLGRLLVGGHRAGFIEDKSLSANQHEFVAMTVEHLTANGTMDPGLLYEPPFTTLARGGPEALFANPEVDELITAIRAVDSSTRPRDEAA
jgi:hypothetical protein